MNKTTVFHILFSCSLVVLIFALLPLQTSFASDEGKSYSKALIIYNGGEDIKYSKQYGTEQLIYKIKIKYPADDVLSFLNKGLKDQGWSPLEDDFLNPGLKSSHVRGWTSFIDATKEIDHKVFQWLAQWKNSNGDIAWYGLRYEYPVNGPNDTMNLQIIGKYIPVKVYEEILKEMEPSTPFNKTINPTGR